MITANFTDNIPAAAEALTRGGLVAVPTETVYGLAANALDEAAVDRLFAVKGRPENKPLSLMVSGVEAIDALCGDVPKAAYALADFFWPGPLTIVLKARPGIPDAVRAGGETIGLRCPRHEKTLALLKALPFPLAVPSANPSGRPSPKDIGGVLEYFDGKIEGYIDGGACRFGLESTVIDMSRAPFKILRQGAANEDDINLALMAGLTIIGITGGTGGGKTTALGVLRGMGALVLDADAIYHELLANSAPLRAAIDARFPGALPSGGIDTKDLGKIVFSDPDALRDLGAITHKFVGVEITRRLTDWAKNSGELAAIDAIALLDGGSAAFCKATVGITAPPEARLERLMRREGISREYAQLRIDAQKPDEYFEANCDYTVSNDGTIENFEEKCKRVFRDIINE